jgi:hypothetical protein
MAHITRCTDSRGEGWDCWYSVDEHKYVAVRDTDNYRAVARTRTGRDRKMNAAPRSGSSPSED